MQSRSAGYYIASLLSISLMLAIAPSNSARAAIVPPQEPKGPVVRLTPAEEVAYSAAHGARATRVVLLPNGLEAFLVSDSKADKSAAAMDVAVGSLSNPPQYLGLAHYLEHMLFLGTAKYPTPGEYFQFIRGNGGYSNAYTSHENTNYHFQVNTSSFEGALDRFAQFFIEPTFDSVRIPKEMINVDSEYQKNIDQTGWRRSYLEQILSNPSHPLQNLFQGNQDTLGNVPRAVLVDFYTKYYSANQMKLSVISPLPLDQLESLVTAKFAAVPNRNLPKLSFDSEVIRPQDLPRLISFKSADPSHSLTLSIEVPSTAKLWDTQPLDMIASLLSYSGPNSLVSSFKNRGWVLALQSGGNSESYSSQFLVVLKLTEEGDKHIPEITREIFAQLKHIADVGLPRGFFDDLALAAKLDFIYGSPQQKGAELASEFAKQMTIYGSADALEAKLWLMHRYDDAEFRSFARLLTPDRVTIYHSGPEIQGTQKARFYGIEYSVAALANEKWFADLAQVSPANYALPPQNPFLPKDLSVIDQGKLKARKVVETEFGSLWHSPTQFQTPRATVSAILRRPKQVASPRTAALDNIYPMVVEEALKEWGEPARRAGMSYSIESTSGIITITVSGYSERVPLFTTSLFEQLSKINPTDEQLSTVRNALTTRAQSVYRQPAYDRGLKLLRTVVRPQEFDITEWAKELPNISRQDVIDDARSRFAKLHMKLMTFGNLDTAAAQSLFQGIPVALASAPLPIVEQGPAAQEIILDEGASYGYWTNSEGDNNAWVGVVHLGSLSPANDARIALINNYFTSPFYEEMRGRRTLGYITEAQATSSRFSSLLYFIIQSAHPADELVQQSMEWSREWAKNAAVISDADFAELKASAIEGISQPPASYDEEYEKFTTAIENYGGNFQHLNEEIAAAKSIKKSEFAEFLTRAFDPTRKKSINIYVTAKGLGPKAIAGETSITDIGFFHRSRPAQNKLD